MTLRTDFIKKTRTFNVSFIGASLKTYAVGKGFLRKFIRGDQEDIQKLTSFFNALPNTESDRPLTNIELFALYEILINAKTIPTHLSDGVFSDLKKWFGIKLIKNLLKLKNAESLNQETFTLVTAHPNFSSMTAAILFLKKKSQINTQENRAALLSADDPEKVAQQMEVNQSIISLLNSVGINVEKYQKVIDKYNSNSSTDFYKFLNQINSKTDIETVFKHTNPLKMASALVRVKKFSNLFTAENCEAIKNAADPDNYAKMIYAGKNLLSLIQGSEIDKPKVREAIDNCSNLILLNEALQNFRYQQLTLVNFEAVYKHSNPVSMASAITLLSEHEELNTAEIRQTLDKEKDPKVYLEKSLAINQILVYLGKEKLDHVEKIALVKKHPDPTQLRIAVNLLERTPLLKNYFDDVVVHPNPNGLASGLMILFYANKIVNIEFETNFALIKQEDHPEKVAIALVVQKLIGYVKASSLLTYLMTELGKHLNQDFIAYCDKLITESFAASINFSQNSHTPSVHKSASDSAFRLAQRYYGKIILETTLNEIKDWSKKLTNKITQDNQLILTSAQKAIDSIIDDKLFYVDHVSKISLIRLLAITWVAIHDTDILTCDAEEAERLFIEGLYEIERGDNLDEKGIDDGQSEDKRICKSGAFNKLIEKLTGIHPDAEIIFMTKQTATWKIPMVVKEEVFNFLVYPKTKEELDYSLKMINELELRGIQAIWAQIKTNVEKRMFDEFGPLFQDQDDPSFRAIIMAGEQNTKFDKRDELLAKIKKSPVYMDSMATISNASVFKQKASIDEKQPAPKILIRKVVRNS